MDQSVIFETFSVRRIYHAATAAQVFAAWADPKARLEWCVPSADEAIEYVEADFSVGGKDVSLCGNKGDMAFRIVGQYQHIEEPQLIVFTEHFFKRNSSDHDVLLGISLITVEITETEVGAEMALTAQMSSLVGEEMISGNKNGWATVSKNLGKYLEIAP